MFSLYIVNHIGYLFAKNNYCVELCNIDNDYFILHVSSRAERRNSRCLELSQTDYRLYILQKKRRLSETGPLNLLFLYYTLAKGETLSLRHINSALKKQHLL